MKFAFSTLGCPDWLWEEIITVAADMGFDGIELRGIGSEIYLPHVKNFAPENIPALRKKLTRLNLEIPCLTTGAFLFDETKIEEAKKEVSDYITLAKALAPICTRVGRLQSGTDRLMNPWWRKICMNSFLRRPKTMLLYFWRPTEFMLNPPNLPDY